MKDLFGGIISFMLFLFISGAIIFQVIINNFQLRKANHIQERKVHLLEKENQRLIATAESFSNENQDLRFRKDQLVTRLQESEQEKKAAKRELKSETKKLKKLTSKNQRLKSDLKNRDAKIVKIENDKFAQKNQIMKLKNEVQKRNSKIVSLEDDIEMWRLNLEETINHENELIALTHEKNDSLILVSDYNLDLKRELEYAKVKIAISHVEIFLGFFIAVVFFGIMKIIRRGVFTTQNYTFLKSEKALN